MTSGGGGGVDVFRLLEEGGGRAHALEGNGIGLEEEEEGGGLLILFF